MFELFDGIVELNMVFQNHRHVSRHPHSVFVFVLFFLVGYVEERPW